MWKCTQNVNNSNDESTIGHKQVTADIGIYESYTI